MMNNYFSNFLNKLKVIKKNLLAYFNRIWIEFKWWLNDNEDNVGLLFCLLSFITGLGLGLIFSS